MKPQIYLLMLLNRLHRDEQIQQQQKKAVLGCESCSGTIDQKACFCDKCLTLFCHMCSINHNCKQQSDLQCKSSNSKINRYNIESGDRSTYPVSLNQLIQSNRYSKNNMNQYSQNNCQRCQLKVGNLKCISCINKIFCGECFNKVHSVLKFKQHQYINIKSIDQEIRKDIVICITPQLQNKQIETKNTLNCIQLYSGVSYPGQRRLVGNQKNRSFEIQKKQEIKDKIARLALLRNELQSNCSQMQKKLKEIISKTTQQLELVIEQTKLKILEFQMKLKEKIKTETEEYRSVIQEINNAEKNYKNSVYLIEKNLFQGYQQKRVNERMKLMNDKFAKCLRMNEECNRSRVSTYLSQQFFSQIQKVKQNIRRIDYKKLVLDVQQTKNLTCCTMSSPRSDKKKNSTNKMNSDIKPLKCSLNLASCKSMDRMGSLTMSQIQTQSKQVFQEINLLKNVNDINLTQSINCQSYRATPSEQSFKGKYQNKDSKLSSPGIVTGKQKMTIKQFRSKGTLQKSTFIPNNNSENQGKFGVKKTLLNIQKTKKMIKDMRSEINEFNNRYNTDTKDSVHTQKEEEIEYQLQNLTSSRISIESFVLDEETIG